LRIQRDHTLDIESVLLANAVKGRVLIVGRGIPHVKIKIAIVHHGFVIFYCVIRQMPKLPKLQRLWLLVSGQCIMMGLIMQEQ
jgi:hypothetical protein